MTSRGQGHSSAQPFPRPEILGGREGRARGGGRRRSGGGIPIQNIFRPTGHLPGFHQHQPPLRWAAVPPLSTRALSRRRRGDGRCIKRLDPTFRAPPRPLAPPRVRIMLSLFARPARAPPPADRSGMPRLALRITSPNTPSRMTNRRGRDFRRRAC